MQMSEHREQVNRLNRTAAYIAKSESEKLEEVKQHEKKFLVQHSVMAKLTFKMMRYLCLQNYNDALGFTSTTDLIRAMINKRNSVVTRIFPLDQNQTPKGFYNSFLVEEFRFTAAPDKTVG